MINLDYHISDLESYTRIIEEAARDFGLDCYPQEFEICNYEDMLSYEAYSGMPSRYPHWSFGKAWERKKTFYRYNLVGLPYEMVINSNHPHQQSLLSHNHAYLFGIQRDLTPGTDLGPGISL